MAIPPIEPYVMPAEHELPEPRAWWRVDPARAVLLVHDMQQYFVDAFPAGESPRTELVANVARLRAAAHRAAMPVIYTAQPGGMTRVQRGLLHQFWGPGMGTDPGDRRIIAELTPAPGDIVLTKWRYSAFHRSGLHQLLRRLGRDQLVICGVYANIGCLMTACDAFTLDIETFVAADAVADFSAEEHRQALRYAATRCAVTASTAALEASCNTPTIASGVT
jgi:bifunctional isochorismate lyase/aryl carrier protein